MIKTLPPISIVYILHVLCRDISSRDAFVVKLLGVIIKKFERDYLYKIYEKTRRTRETPVTVYAAARRDNAGAISKTAFAQRYRERERERNFARRFYALTSILSPSLVCMRLASHFHRFLAMFRDARARLLSFPFCTCSLRGMAARSPGMTTLRQLFGFITSRKGTSLRGLTVSPPSPTPRTPPRLPRTNDAQRASTVTEAQRTQTPAAFLWRFACYRGCREIVSSPFFFSLSLSLSFFFFVYFFFE